MSAAGRWSPLASRRLWSLWEIMRPFHLTHVLKAVFLGGQNLSLKEVRDLKSLAFPGAQLDDKFTEVDRDSWAEFFKVVEEHCIELELTASLATVRRIIQEAASPNASYTSLAPHHVELQKRLIDEMDSKTFWSMTIREAELYEPRSPLFGWEVQAKFPCGAYDIDEAAKCLALGRSTASAFHSIRCLEAAIRAISRCLGIPDPTKAADRNWGKMLSSIEGSIDRRWPTSTNRLTGDGQTFEEVYAALAAMQNPWRNATMHLDQKYTEEEAKHIFDVVGGLMRRVAFRCDEDGNPKV